MLSLHKNVCSKPYSNLVIESLLRRLILSVILAEAINPAVCYHRDTTDDCLIALMLVITINTKVCVWESKLYTD